ncbi:hypothetical protein F4814DRAFT_460698 [Daldinia grandis]|nr:hypothetical protein F4814DRAFT_460698 [Daldinia grandis]
MFYAWAREPRSVLALSGDATIETDICIYLLGIEGEFLVTMNPEDMNRLRIVTNTAADLLWFTNANILGNTPESMKKMASYILVDMALSVK